MAVKIHHGPPGSYKTSGAIMDDFIWACYEGRTVITNVRGLHDENHVREVLNNKYPKREIPETFELVWIDTGTLDGIWLMERFFWWADCGAFFLVDEAQTFFSADLRPAEYQRWDYPMGPLGTMDKRPWSFLDAITRHRHFGWDFVFTTPHISLINNKFRQVSETAYLHKNQALIGLKGWYLEAYHSAQSNGTSDYDISSVQQKRIPKFIFELYKSTSTGEHTDSFAGRPLWKDPKLIMAVSALALVVIWVLSRPNPFAQFYAQDPAQASETVNNDPVSVSAPYTQGASQVSNSPQGSISHFSSSSDPFTELTNKHIYFVGSYLHNNQFVQLFEVLSKDEKTGIVLTNLELNALGFKVRQYGRSVFQIIKDGKTYYSRYRGNEESEGSFLGG